MEFEKKEKIKIEEKCIKLKDERLKVRVLEWLNENALKLESQ